MLEQVATIMEMSEEEIKSHPHLLVSVIDAQLTILYFNEQCEKYFGIKEENVIGNIVADLWPEQWKAGKFDFLNRAMAGDTVYITNGTYERKPGMYDQVTIPLKNSEGYVYAALNIVIDLLHPREESQPTVSLPREVYFKQQGR